MTLVQLDYIISLDNYRHFAIAAEKCFVTQPTLSMQIQKLEDSLGVIIFDRSKHPVQPTEIGKKILEQARVIVSESQRIQEIIDEEKHDIKGNIRIGVIPTLAPYLIPLFISSFVEKYPFINLQISEHMTDELTDLLKKDQIDIAIMVTPLDNDDLKEIPLFYEEFSVYASHHHPLYKAENINASDLNAEGLWILNEGHCFRNQTLTICRADKAERFNNRVLYESGSLEALKKLVDKRGGYTLIPELFTYDLNKDDKSKIRHFSEPVPTREVGLVVKKSFVKHKLIHALKEEINNTLPATLLSKKNMNVVKL
ncbi:MULTISPECIES: hydrogen peroxide-inducible genes activator [Reichenbachiella]|uniref:hydrogen peroxide-inducible genes activator n=1 Tax=Reichenbachiella TaxID=156993 RepID=UPI00093564EB|nr:MULTISPECIES: hydrogen peroxide-inducible genes activator [Reichenbachiella]MBU2914666.1 LysR family transcriptional regulator [Reichenbachiella agariperforans]RJE72112.1 transcriptional regulator [Reichenbachiella sp. MSK19-1]